MTIHLTTEQYNALMDNLNELTELLYDEAEAVADDQCMSLIRRARSVVKLSTALMSAEGV